MKKITVMIFAFLMTCPFHSFSQDVLGPEYGQVLNVTVPYDRTHPFNSSYEKPVWSPDGKWIAFTSYSQACIYIVKAEGGEARTIYTKENAHINDVYRYSIGKLCFSPDSQKIVFESSVIDTAYGGQFIHTDYLGGILTSFKYDIPYIHTIDIYSGEYTLLVRGGFHPSWSHDGRYIAYVKFDENTWLSENPIEHNGSPVIYDTVTKETRYLTGYTIPDISILGGYYDYNLYKYPVISPDNKSVYLSMLVSGSENIAKIPFEGGTPEVLTSFTNPETRCCDLQFSPGKKWISFGTLYEILVYNISTGKVYDFFTGKEFIERYYADKNQQLRPLSMCWSPEESKICYNLYRNYVNRIYITSFDPEKYSASGTFAKSEKPDGFSIIGNYPNPFNPSTTLSFSIPEKSFVSVDIYNMAGQKVKTLVNGTMSAGVHSIKWDAGGCSAGVYFYKVKAGKYEKTMRMTFVK